MYWSVGWLVGRWGVQCIGCSVGRSVGGSFSVVVLVGRSLGWSVGGSVGVLDNWSVGRLVALFFSGVQTDCTLC